MPPSISRSHPAEMEIEQLVRLILPPRKPRNPGTPKTWKKTGARLGIRFPADYKVFIDTYGSGSFDDFILVYNPFAEHEYLNLFYALDTLHQADRQARRLGDPVWTAVHPFELFPASVGLLPWGCTTDIRAAFFWWVKGPPETWETVFYNLRNGEYEVWKYSLTGFLYRLFTHQIESVLLPEDYLPQDGVIHFIPAR